MDECIHGIGGAWCGICNATVDAGSTSRTGDYGFHRGRSKQDVLTELCQALGIRGHHVGAGSSLPAEVFEVVAARFALSNGSMPQVGKALAAKAGLQWGANCDSTGSVSGGGSTVTVEGLEIMVQAVRRLA